jgi:hypothetical protein
LTTTAAGDRRPVNLAKAIAAAIVFLAVVVLPATASASLRLPASFSEAMHLRGTHGFRLELILVDRRRLLVQVERGSPRGGEQSVFYSTNVRGRAGTAIDTPIGKLGRVAVRFVPRSRTHQPANGECVGDGTTTEYGRFVGRIVFRGERGYTQVKTRGSSRTGVLGKRPGLPRRESPSVSPLE